MPHKLRGRAFYIGTTMVTFVKYRDCCTCKTWAAALAKYGLLHISFMQSASHDACTTHMFMFITQQLPFSRRTSLIFIISTTSSLPSAHPLFFRLFLLPSLLWQAGGQLPSLLLPIPPLSLGLKLLRLALAPLILLLSKTLTCWPSLRALLLSLFA